MVPELTHYQKYGKKSYQKNREKCLAQQRTYYHERGGAQMKHAHYNRVRWGYTLKHRYNITPEDYERMYEEQGGVCAICGGPQASDKKRFDIDHDHTTGEVRGLLCNNCNRGLGHLQDSVPLLKKAVEYLSGS